MHDRDALTDGEGGGRTPSPLRRRRAVGVLVLASALSVGGMALIAGVRPSGHRAPLTPFDPGALSGFTLDGLSRTLPTDSAYTLLYVSPECPFCRAELAARVRRARAHPSLAAPIVVFAPGTTRGRAMALLHGYPHPVLLDRTGSIGRALRISVVPCTISLDASGRAVAVHLGLTRTGGEISSRTTTGANTR